MADKRNEIDKKTSFYSRTNFLHSKIKTASVEMTIRWNVSFQWDNTISDPNVNSHFKTEEVK